MDKVDIVANASLDIISNQQPKWVTLMVSVLKDYTLTDNQWEELTQEAVKIKKDHDSILQGGMQTMTPKKFSMELRRLMVFQMEQWCRIKKSPFLASQIINFNRSAVTGDLLYGFLVKPSHVGKKLEESLTALFLTIHMSLQSLAVSVQEADPAGKQVECLNVFKKICELGYTTSPGSKRHDNQVRIKMMALLKNLNPITQSLIRNFQHLTDLSIYPLANNRTNARDKFKLFLINIVDQVAPEKIDSEIYNELLKNTASMIKPFSDWEELCVFKIVAEIVYAITELTEALAKDQETLELVMKSEPSKKRSADDGK